MTIDMNISNEQFENLVNMAIDSLPEKFLERINNLAVFIEDYPTKEQLKKTKVSKEFDLFGLFEGYHQASRVNFGPVLPDRITIFRKPILKQCSTAEEVKKQVVSTVKHEIAHHFGSDEKGARKAAK